MSQKYKIIDCLENYASQINDMISRINEINDENKIIFFKIAQKLSETFSTLAHSKQMREQLKHQLKKMTNTLNRRGTQLKCKLWSKISDILLPNDEES